MRAKVDFDEAEAALVDMATLEAIYLAGVWRQWGEVKLKNDELEEVHQSARDSESDYAQAVQKLEQHLKPYGMRLGAALAAIGGNSPLKQETQLLLSTLLLLVGIIAGFDAAFSGNMGSAAVAVLCIIGGIGWRVLVKCLIWWCHE